MRIEYTPDEVEIDRDEQKRLARIPVRDVLLALVDLSAELERVVPGFTVSEGVRQLCERVHNEQTKTLQVLQKSAGN